MNENNENKLVPRLRFPEFTEPWYIISISDICEVYKGSTFSKADINENGYRPCIHYGELFTKYNEVISYIYSKTNKSYGFKSEVGDILMPSSDVTPDGLAKASAIMLNGVILGGDMNILRPQKEINPIFISYLLNRTKRDIIKLVSGTTVKHIYPSQIITCRLPIVKNGIEQQKIAACLSSLDDVINAESKKLEVLKEHKKGLLQNLFPQQGETVPKLRFKEFEDSGEWEEYPINSIGEVVTGGTPSKEENEYWGGDFVWVTAQDFKGKYITDSVLKLTQKGKEKSRIIPKNSVLVTCIASIGLNGINKVECATNQQINSVVCNSENHYEFVYYSITKNGNRLKNLAGQTAVPIINKSVFEKFIIHKPKSYQEQQKIAACLSSIDDLINAQSQKIETLKLHKKGLLQGLFPDVNEHNG
jgi:type I restriction enzyme S subunit